MIIAHAWVVGEDAAAFAVDAAAVAAVEMSVVC